MRTLSRKATAGARPRTWPRRPWQLPGTGHVLCFGRSGRKLAAVELRDAVCVVTGASSGIGRATALRLAREGARVVPLGRDRAALEGLPGGGGGSAVVADLARTEDVARAAADALSAFGRVDILVNNAGLGW